MPIGELTCAIFWGEDTVDVLIHNKELKRQLTMTFDPLGMSLVTIDENMKRFETIIPRKENNYEYADDLCRVFLWLDGSQGKNTTPEEFERAQ